MAIDPNHPLLQPGATFGGRTAEPAAGWYPDPMGSGRLRYWTGVVWTDAMDAPADSDATAGKKVWDVLRGFLVVLGVLFALGLLWGGWAALSQEARTEHVLVTVSAPPSVCWSGFIGGATHDGCGPATVDTLYFPSGRVVSASVQKQGADSQGLTMAIVSNGTELARNSTSAAYGIVVVTATT